ncbi:MAG: hypothetical protein R3301_18825 [Saprospiraceae bacterium]|nr:hypothetical protein [Saprospiraceae bacterium]
MKRSLSVTLRTLLPVCLIVCLFGCGDSLTDDVQPLTTSTVISDVAASGDAIAPEIFGGRDGDPGSEAVTAIDIDVVPCSLNTRSRAFALLVYSHRDRNTEVFAQDRYTVLWYGYDGALLSDTNRLECVASGSYYVHVMDTVSGNEGRAAISL